MSQSELLNRVVAAMEAIGIPFMLTGSYASSLQGEPRLTHDIDLVITLSVSEARQLVQRFASPDYYLDESAVLTAIAQKREFNLIDVNSGDKVDFWLLTDDAFDQSRFARRYPLDFRSTRLFVSRPEDTILMKLRWAALTGGSEKQLGDARGILELQRETLDLPYIEKWAAILGVESLWQQIQAETE